MKQRPRNTVYKSFEEFRDACLKIKAGYPAGHGQRTAIDVQIERERVKNETTR